MDKWRVANRARKYWTIILALVGVIGIISGQLISVDTLKNVVGCIGTSFISAAITIFLIKFDILDMLQNDKMDRFGIYDILEGRDDVFNSGKEGRGVLSWEEFLERSSDYTIDIVGISLYSFLFTKNLIPVLKNLVEDKNFKVRIVFANPHSSEVDFQSEEEHKKGKLEEHIIWLSEKIRKEINCSRLEVYYAKTMPRAFIVRSGDEMIITPYLLKGPFKEPTLWVKKSGYVKNTYYKTYRNYIDSMVGTSIPVQ
ncbi:hypothetical protein SAMN06296386_112104 [Lachnospiraceae bacterium]|nr:hypothetical protein SAMN06296386_112104 [Lachnospiraceae bacterium]